MNGAQAERDRETKRYEAKGLHVVPANRVGHGEQLASTNAHLNTIAIMYKDYLKFVRNIT